jgi:hypothetical protein
MAIYHASFKAFARSKGHSSVAAAAYRAGADLQDTVNNRKFEYSKRSGVASAHMLAPRNAPEWAFDIAAFWDANEAWEKRANARLGYELEVSLPADLSKQQRGDLANALGQFLVDRYQAAVLVAVHEPSGQGDKRNHHTHLLMSARKIGPQGFGDRAGKVFQARGDAGNEEIRLLREEAGRIINDHLAMAGLNITVDHRSLKDQARAAAKSGDYKLAVKLSREPTKHKGVGVVGAERREQSAQSARRDEQDWWSANMELARAEGRLVEFPEGHSHQAALADQSREKAWKSDGKWKPRDPRDSVMSPAARVFDKIARIARAEGKGAHVLNVEAQLVEDWLASQRSAAEEALRQVSAAGCTIEPLFQQAVDAVSVNRVPIYGLKPWFFQDSEWLCEVLLDYGRQLRRPREQEAKIGEAYVAVKVAEQLASRAGAPSVVGARAKLHRAQGALTRSARKENERRVKLSREVLETTLAKFEEDYRITHSTSIFDEPTPPPASDLTTKSGSNKRELKPRISGSMGSRR